MPVALTIAILSYQEPCEYAPMARAGDKQLTGQVRISFWKDPSMPQFKGQLLIDERTPDIFYQNYFSNHYRWENDFKKEKRFALSGTLSVERWSMEVEYNLMHISDFIYFNQEASPAQADNVTLTSVSAEKNFRLGGLNFFNRLVWQANTNSDVISLPHISVFSALFYERELVKNALTAQLGTNVFYRSYFYADSYSPALGQFYNQRSKKIGNYPTVDIFANLKWKSVLIHLKYEHANQGFPNSQYFSALHYPINPRVFKFGLSWDILRLIVKKICGKQISITFVACLKKSFLDETFENQQHEVDFALGLVFILFFANSTISNPV